jgi:hypothetical protein
LIEAVKDWYWWQGLKEDALKCLKDCIPCQKDRPHPPVNVPLQETWKGSRPFQGWHIDLAGPFPADDDGNKYLFVAVDPFSKWVEALPLPSKDSWRTARALYKVLARWGKPAWVTTDNGLEFAGHFR